MNKILPRKAVVESSSTDSTPVIISKPNAVGGVRVAMNRKSLNDVQKKTFPANSETQRKQLSREIKCLERQLERLRYLNGHFDRRTQVTYEEMIASRKELLDALGE